MNLVLSTIQAQEELFKDEIRLCANKTFLSIYSFVSFQPEMNIGGEISQYKNNATLHKSYIIFSKINFILVLQFAP